MHRWVEGELDPTARSTLRGHLRDCRRCRGTLRRLRAEKAWITRHALSGPQLPEGFASKATAHIQARIQEQPAPRTAAGGPPDGGASSAERQRAFPWRRLGRWGLHAAPSAAAALLVALVVLGDGRRASRDPTETATSGIAGPFASAPIRADASIGPDSKSHTLVAWQVPGTAAVDFCAVDSFMDHGFCPAIDPGVLRSSGRLGEADGLRAERIQAAGRISLDPESGGQASSGGLARSPNLGMLLRSVVGRPSSPQDRRPDPGMSAKDSAEDPCHPDLNADGRADFNDLAHYCQVLMSANLPGGLGWSQTSSDEGDCLEPCT
jgi:hypothetical protein